MCALIRDVKRSERRDEQCDKVFARGGELTEERRIDELTEKDQTERKKETR